MFTKQHYEVIARVISSQVAITDSESDLIDSIIKEFIREFKKDNYAFDKKKFIEACHWFDEPLNLLR